MHMQLGWWKMYYIRVLEIFPATDVFWPIERVKYLDYQ